MAKGRELKLWNFHLRKLGVVISDVKGFVEHDFISFVKNERTPKYQVCYLCRFNGPIINNRHYDAHMRMVSNIFAQGIRQNARTKKDS